MVEETKRVARNSGGDLVVEMDELRSLLTPYTFNGDLNGGTGKQAKANTGGLKIYITGLYLKENAAAAETFQIFDGTVAAGTKLVDIDVAASGEPSFDNLLPIGPFESTSGIFVYTASASDMSLIMSFKRDAEVVE